MTYSIFHLMEKIKPAPIAYAHCDIPCGIYDPHLAQMAAHTVIRMNSLINELVSKMPANPTIEERRDFVHKLARYTHTKEEHAEKVKQEVRILWGDYFKPEHVKQFPELHELVWKAMKLGSQARQEVNLKASEDLLETVNKIAEIFWRTKDKKTFRVKAPYPTEKETVFPKLD